MSKSISKFFSALAKVLRKKGYIVYEGTLGWKIKNLKFSHVNDPDKWSDEESGAYCHDERCKGDH